MIQLLSTPEYNEAYISRWLATESPNYFRLQRRDYEVSSISNVGGFIKFSLTTAYTGNLDNTISALDATNVVMLTGLVTAISGNDVTTDIPYVANTFLYLNDFTARANYYFEGRLTINGIVNDLTVIASPNTLGYADVDVSGVLQTVISNSKTGDYTSDTIAEVSKSGKFTFEYREAWYESDEAYTAEPNTWFYAEFVRSKTETSNLWDFVPTIDATYDIGGPLEGLMNTVPACNLFENPVFFAGLPFDLSYLNFIDCNEASFTATIKKYDSANALISTYTITQNYDISELKNMNSLNIDPALIESNTAYITIEMQMLNVV